MNEVVRMTVCNRCHEVFDSEKVIHGEFRYIGFQPAGYDLADHEHQVVTHQVVTHYDLCGRCAVDLTGDWMNRFVCLSDLGGYQRVDRGAE